MTSDIPSIRRIQLGLVEDWARNQSFPWFSRVPSPSNLADSVSRNEMMPYLAEKAERVTPMMQGLFKVTWQERKLEKRKAMKMTYQDKRKRGRYGSR